MGLIMEQCVLKESDQNQPLSPWGSSKSLESYDSDEENSLISAHHNKNRHF